MKKYFLSILIIIPTIVMANSISVEKLIGQFDEQEDPNFISLDTTILPVNKPNMYLQKEPTQQLIKAYQAFHNQHPNIPFIVVSATRNYHYQNGIWKKKWQKLSPTLKEPPKVANEILKYSSMPGSSRHHWGTDVDITRLDSHYFQVDPKGKILYQWLIENMPKYGFCRPFSEGRTGGYQPEEWHWSYKPIAKQYQAQYQLIMEKSPQKILNKLNFIGANNIALEKLINEFVFSIDDSCIN